MRTEASDRQSLYVANEISKRGHQHFAPWADYTVDTDVSVLAPDGSLRGAISDIIQNRCKVGESGKRIA
jgi:hypothetical protein